MNEEVRYLLPALTGHGGATVPIEGSSQAILFSLLGTEALRAGSTRMRFALRPDPSSGGFHVFSGQTRVGRLPKSLRDMYPQIDHLIAQSIVPEVSADITLKEGTGRLEGDLNFPAPSQILPSNQPPAQPWAMLPETTGYEVDVSEGDAAGFLRGVAPCLLYATVSVVDDAVVAAVGKRVIGALSPEDSAQVRGYIDHLQTLELVAIAQLYVIDDGKRVILSATPTEDLPDSALEPAISPVPELRAYRPSTGEFAAVEGDTPQEWALTVAGAEVTEDFPAISTDQPRTPVTSPSMPAVRPTTLAGNNTAEVEPAQQSAPAQQAPEEKAGRGFPVLALLILLIGIGVLAFTVVSMNGTGQLILGGVGIFIVLISLLMFLRRRR